MSRLALYLLGPPRVELDGRPVHLGRRKMVALLAYLAVTGKRHRRDSLAVLLWPECDQSRALGYLRRLLSLLKRTLGEGWLAIDRDQHIAQADSTGFGQDEAMRAVANAARETGCCKLALSSNVARAGAHRFYSRLGWKRTYYGFSVDL